LLRVNVVHQEYLRERLSMQLRTCRQTRDLRKELFLSVRRDVWECFSYESPEARWIRSVEAAHKKEMEQVERVWQQRLSSQRAEEARRHEQNEQIIGKYRERALKYKRQLSLQQDIHESQGKARKEELVVETRDMSTMTESSIEQGA
jgi:hypothetical protein